MNDCSYFNSITLTFFRYRAYFPADIESTVFPNRYWIENLLNGVNNSNIIMKRVPDT